MGQRAMFAAELTDHWTTHNLASGETTQVEAQVEAEYLEVLAVRR